jgi:uncharacterized protein YyaL (SSP411 family)
MTSPSSPTNRLAHETSPYLLQHASNPVDWHPWGEEALAKAQREQKPILLSIGYSACHWCHVMAHESFEDSHTAAVMNELFVNVKVDREERPDIDKIYQLAHQVLTRRGGGWPLTMFLTHDDQRPFFGGTYFPDTPRHGMPAFTELLQRVAEYYRERQDDIRKQNESLMEVYADLVPEPARDTKLDAAPIQQARNALAQDFDKQFGGFGGAPKFPHPMTIELLLRCWRATAGEEQPDLQSLYMAGLTLTRMGEGGIYDQLGGGFSRYSVDMYWMIPHFEKMLYDNGPLLANYAHVAVATGDPLYSRIANETADWMIRDMQSPRGAFWSTLDADSEGHEGRFYVWDTAELGQLLTPAQYRAIEQRFGLEGTPNFEGEWHLHVHRSIDDVAAALQIPPAEATALLDSARRVLLDTRNRRVWPGRDEKILTAWNGLAIRGLAIAARVLQRPELADAATRAVDFVRNELWSNSRLLAVYKDGRARFPAYLDDHAFLLHGLLELLETRWRGADLEFAVSIADALLEHFEDRNNGGFFFTADDQEALIHRPKSYADEATPAGNGIAAFALNRLGYLLGETRYIDAAERTLRAAWPSVTRYPHGHAAILVALEEFLTPPTIIILRGEQSEITSWQRELNKVYAPRRIVLAVPSDAATLPAAIAEKTVQEESVAYICRGTVCSEPIKSLSALVALTRE